MTRPRQRMVGPPVIGADLRGVLSAHPLINDPRALVIHCV